MRTYTDDTVLSEVEMAYTSDFIAMFPNRNGNPIRDYRTYFEQDKFKTGTKDDILGYIMGADAILRGILSAEPPANIKLQLNIAHRQVVTAFQKRIADIENVPAMVEAIVGATRGGKSTAKFTAVNPNDGTNLDVAEQKSDASSTIKSVSSAPAPISDWNKVILGSFFGDGNIKTQRTRAKRVNVYCTCTIDASGNGKYEIEVVGTPSKELFVSRITEFWTILDGYKSAVYMDVCNGYKEPACLSINSSVPKPTMLAALARVIERLEKNPPKYEDYVSSAGGDTNG